MWNDDRDPSARHGWLLHGLQTPDQATIAHAELACDREFAQFLFARLEEEIHAAVRRARPSPQLDEGLQLLHELARDLRLGRLPDDVTLDVVVAAFAAHPDFRARWRTPAELLPVAPTTAATLTGRAAR